MKATSTKNRILAAALRILECKGVQKLSQTSVAKEAGIPQGQLTYHFKKRADLILGVTESALNEIGNFLSEKRDQLTERSLETIVPIVLELLKNKNRTRSLLGLFVEGDESKEVRDTLIERGQRVRKLIAAALSLEENSPELTAAHANLIGFSILFFFSRDKATEKKLEEDFLESFKLFRPMKGARK